MIEKEKIRSPVEDDSDLMAEYGRAFILINAVENELEHFIDFFGKLDLVDPMMKKKIMRGRGLGGKIGLVSDILPSSLHENLNTLNEKRILLAHSPVGEKHHVVNNEVQRTGIYTIGNRGYSDLCLTTEFLSEIADFARVVASELLDEYSNRLQKTRKNGPPSVETS